MLFALVVVLCCLFFGFLAVLEKPQPLIAAQMQYNETLKLINSPATLDSLPVILNRTNACKNPVHVASISVDCVALCDQAGAIMKTIPTNSSIIWNNQKYGPGNYCMLADPVDCNRHTTQLVYDNAGWRCIPIYSEFGGPVGTDILVCGGSIHDAATNQVYQGQIPVNLSLSSPEEIYKNSYRFNCIRDMSSVTLNTLASLKQHHLIQFENPCTEGIANPIKIEYDALLDKCHCLPPLYETKGVCSSCPEGLGHKDYRGLEYNYALYIPCKDYRLPFDGEPALPCHDRNCYQASIYMDASDEPVGPTYKFLVDAALHKDKMSDQKNSNITNQEPVESTRDARSVDSQRPLESQIPLESKPKAIWVTSGTEFNTIMMGDDPEALLTPMNIQHFQHRDLPYEKLRDLHQEAIYYSRLYNSQTAPGHATSSHYTEHVVPEVVTPKPKHSAAKELPIVDAEVIEQVKRDQRIQHEAKAVGRELTADEIKSMEANLAKALKAIEEATAALAAKQAARAAGATATSVPKTADAVATSESTITVAPKTADATATSESTETADAVATKGQESVVTNESEVTADAAVAKSQEAAVAQDSTVAKSQDSTVPKTKISARTDDASPAKKQKLDDGSAAAVQSSVEPMEVDAEHHHHHVQEYANTDVPDTQTAQAASDASQTSEPAMSKSQVDSKLTSSKAKKTTE